MKNNPKIYAHVPYIGTTGYNNHTRDFLRHLSKYLPVKVRNFTVGKSWKNMSETPHDGESYLNETDKKLLYNQTLFTDSTDSGRADYPMYRNFGEDFKEDVHLVLQESNHHYFYDGYVGPKIAYNVWESTLQTPDFFKALLSFDQIWVPSKWQAQCTIDQGADPSKVKVVPEGVDTGTFFPEEVKDFNEYTDGRFKFIVFGRWDYRKSTKEIIECFISEFSEEEPVDLIVSIDNPWGENLDGCKTTEERLLKFGISDPRIKIRHFVSREDYIKYIKKGHVFLSCARSEGWNLPLIEAMSSGTPAIYSECSAQMEFAQGKGIPVKVNGTKAAKYNSYSNYSENLGVPFIPGDYYEPDYEDLKRAMRDAYSNYDAHKKKAISDSKIIHEKFNWDTVAKMGRDVISDFYSNYKPPKTVNKIEVSYLEGPKVEITGNEEEEYLVEFLDSDSGDVIHSGEITNNMWITCGRKYYTNWEIRINGTPVDKFNLSGKKVLISIESSSLGDTLAWSPYAVEFSKKHNCKVILSTFNNAFFKGIPEYSDIEFINPGDSVDCHSVYRIGWFRNENGGWDNGIMHPSLPNTVPLQKTATDILGLDYKEVNYGIARKKTERPISKKYVVLGPQATSGCKEWTREGWEILSRNLSGLGLKPLILTKDPYHIDGVQNISGVPLNEAIRYLEHSEFMIGLGSGLSWLNWALGKKTVMINGFSEDDHEFKNGLIRVSNDVCIKCWNDDAFSFDAGDWNWCPVYKGTKKQHICQKSISSGQVISAILNNNLIGPNGSNGLQ